MRTIKITLLTLITFLSFACSSDDDDNNEPSLTKTELRVIAKGASVAQEKTIIHPQTGEAFEAICFLMDLIDAESGAIIGTVEDCNLSTTELQDGTLVSKVITTFNFNGKGSITAESSVLQTPLGNGLFETSFEPTDKNIIGATYEFEGAQGTVSLYGKIDLSSFDNHIVIFNCDFLLKFTY